jgi:small subunit ribosomal protein S16
MVVLRLKRLGRTHRPFFRVCAMDKRSPRDGRVIEELGWYDPIAPDTRQVELNAARIDYWLSVGAQPSDTVRGLLRKAGIDPKPGKRVVAG